MYKNGIWQATSIVWDVTLDSKYKEGLAVVGGLLCYLYTLLPVVL